MNNIFISTTSFAKYDKGPIRILEEKGLDVTINPHGRKLNKVDMVHFLDNAIGLIAGTEVLDKDVLSRFPLLKVISRCGVGVDNIDLKAAEELGIKVFNTPDAPTLAVAELTVGLILNLLRKVNQMHVSVKNGEWEKCMGSLLSDKKLGIVGFGRIGRKVAELLSSFGCEIAYADPYIEDGIMGLTKLSMSKLLRWSDIISVHVSGEGRLIGKDEIEMMKKGAWLINVSRGGIIDEDGLYQALKQGHLTGAVIDVFEQEPYAGPLRELDNIILTPHVGSYAKESRIKMERSAAENLIKGLGL